MATRAPSGETPNVSASTSGSKPPSFRRVDRVSRPGAKSCTKTPFVPFSSWPRNAILPSAVHRARDVVLGHWEDFFVPQDEHAIDGRVYPIPSFGKETPEFVARARRALRAAGSTGDVWLPCPTRSTFQFLPEAGS